MGKILILLVFFGLILAPLSEARGPPIMALRRCYTSLLCDCGESGFNQLNNCFRMLTKEYQEIMADKWNECGVFAKNVTADDLSSYKEQMCSVPFKKRGRCFISAFQSLRNYMVELTNANRSQEVLQNKRYQTCLDPKFAFCATFPGECKSEI